MSLPSGFFEAHLPLVQGGSPTIGPADMVFLRCVTGSLTDPTVHWLSIWPGWRLYGGPLRFDQVKNVRGNLAAWALQAGRSIATEVVPLVPFELLKPPHTDFRWYPWTFEHARGPRWRIAQVHPITWQKVA